MPGFSKGKVFYGIQFAARRGLIKRPLDMRGNAQPLRLRVTDPLQFDESDWDATKWNPAEGTSYHDPEASPKPTWEELVSYIKLFEVDTSRIPDSLAYELFIDEQDFSTRERRASLSTAPTGNPTLHRGDGIEHMPALIHLSGDAMRAGQVLPNVVLRTAGHERHLLHTEEAVHEFIGESARHRNALESVKNELMRPYLRLKAIFTDEDEHFDERYQAGLQMLDLANGYQEALIQGIALFDPHILPDDLPTLQAVLIERLEGVATGHQKSLKGALTQQAIDNWAACVDMDAALTEIAKRCVLGVIEIEAAADDIWKRTAGTWTLVTDVGSLPASEEHEGDDPPAASLGSDGEHYRQLTGIGEAKDAFAAAQQSIESVSAANIPTWAVTRHASPNTIEYTNGGKASLSGATKAIVDCKQVSGVEGKVSQRIPQAEYSGGSPAPLAMRTLKRPSGKPTWHSAVIELAAGETKPVTVRFLGRNICGSSQFTVTLTP